MINFSKYAEEKFDILRDHKFTILKEQVQECIKDPDRLNQMKKGLYLVQRSFSSHYDLNVIFKKEGETKKIITFFPSQREADKK